MRFGKYLENENINFIHLNLTLNCSYRITVLDLHLRSGIDYVETV